MMPDTEDRFTRALRLAAFDAITEELLQKKYITESEARDIQKRITRLRKHLDLPAATNDHPRIVIAQEAK